MSVFITGGTTGLGLEIAKIYLAEGRNVAICGRTISKLNLSEFSQEQLQHLSTYEVDVKDRLTLQKFMHEFTAQKGPLHLVVACAGISMGNKTAIPDFRRAEDIIDTNIKGTLYVVESAIEIFLKQRSEERSEEKNGKENKKEKGHIVLIGSVAGFNGLPHTSIYSASKAAICKMGESFAIDLKPFGIDVTTFAPGFVDTPLTRLNKHPMPFMITAPKAARLMVNAIRRKKTFFIYPLRMKWVTLVLSYLPRGFYIGAMRLGISLFQKEKNDHI